MDTYNPRIIDRLLSDELDAMGAIILEGPKACGKTTTAEQRAHSTIFMDDPVRCNQYLQMVETDISYILRGETPRLIDEWQIAPKIWDAVRYEVDHRRDDGQFILTGSAVPPTQNRADMRHSGTGRFSWLMMRPMTLWESHDSNGAVSMTDLFRQGNVEPVRGINDLKLEDIAFLTCRGGWPRAVDKGRENQLCAMP